MVKILATFAVILGGIAAYFLWAGNNEGAFVSGVAGAVSFFLFIRANAKTRVDERIREKLEFEDFECGRLEAAETNNFVDSAENSAFSLNERN